MGIGDAHGLGSVLGGVSHCSGAGWRGRHEWWWNLVYFTELFYLFMGLKYS